jgi:tetratricopeptide (TPR) repeat protein
MAAVIVALGAATPARADERYDEAKAIFAQAGEAFEAGDRARAAELYQRAFDTYPTPTAAFWHGRALASMGRLVAADARYRVAAEWVLTADAPPAYAEARAAAEREREALAPRIPHVVLRVTAAGAEVEIDGKLLAPQALNVRLPVDPGAHVVSARAPGRAAFRRALELAEGAQVALEVELPELSVAGPTAAPPSRETRPAEPGLGAQRIAGAVFLGLGGAGAVVWAVSGGLYLSKQAEVDERCDPAPEGGDEYLCDSQDAVDAAEAGKVLGTVNDVALFAGLGCAALGAVLLLTASDEGEAAVSLAPSRSGIGLGLEGRF